MRLINADALKKHYAWWEDDRQKLFDSIVDSQPTVDAVEVIRCKDCAHYHNWAHCPMFFAIYRTGYEQNPDDYCSRAERREE